MAKNCGCGVMKAAGDPHGRSISSLGGLRTKAKRIECKYEKRAGKRKWTCRDEKGRRVKTPKRKRGRR